MAELQHQRLMALAGQPYQRRTRSVATGCGLGMELYGRLGASAS